MKDTFHDFLMWFSGWSENIDAAPTERQWSRLKSKIEEITETVSMPPQPASVAVSRQPMVGQPSMASIALTPGASNDADGEIVRSAKKLSAVSPVHGWRARFMGELIERHNFDPESAAEMVPKYIDVTVDPIAAARHEAEKGK